MLTMHLHCHCATEANATIPDAARYSQVAHGFHHPAFPFNPRHYIVRVVDLGFPFCPRLLAKLNRLSKQGVSPLTSTLTNISKAFEQVSLIKFYDIDKSATTGRDSNSLRLRPVHLSMLVTRFPLDKRCDAPQTLVATVPLIKSVTGVEPVFSAWEADVLTVVLHRHLGFKVSQPHILGYLLPL